MSFLKIALGVGALSVFAAVTFGASAPAFAVADPTVSFSPTTIWAGQTTTYTVANLGSPVIGCVYFDGVYQPDQSTIITEFTPQVLSAELLSTVYPGVSAFGVVLSKSNDCAAAQADQENSTASWSWSTLSFSVAPEPAAEVTPVPELPHTGVSESSTFALIGGAAVALMSGAGMFLLRRRNARV